jgi:hypothetical protein
MAINVVRFNGAGTPRWGVVTGSQVHTLEIDASSTAQFMENGVSLARAAALQPAPDRDGHPGRHRRESARGIENGGGAPAARPETLGDVHKRRAR